MFLPYVQLQCLAKPAIAKYLGAHHPKFQTSGPLLIMTDSSRNCSLTHQETIRLQWKLLFLKRSSHSPDFKKVSLLTMSSNYAPHCEVVNNNMPVLFHQSYPISITWEPDTWMLALDEGLRDYPERMGLRFCHLFWQWNPREINMMRWWLI